MLKKWLPLIWPKLTSPASSFTTLQFPPYVPIVLDRSLITNPTTPSSELVWGFMFSVEGACTGFFLRPGFPWHTLGPSKVTIWHPLPPPRHSLTHWEGGWLCDCWAPFVSCRGAFFQKWRFAIVPRWRSGRRWSWPVILKKFKNFLMKVFVPCLSITVFQYSLFSGLLIA